MASAVDITAEIAVGARRDAIGSHGYAAEAAVLEVYVGRDAEVFAIVVIGI